MKEQIMSRFIIGDRIEFNGFYDIPPIRGTVERVEVENDIEFIVFITPNRPLMRVQSDSEDLRLVRRNEL
jgi:hypothetical protein